MSFGFQEEPAWLIAKVDQRLAMMHETAPGIERLLGVSGVMLMMLTDPAPGQAQAEWERQCDRCGEITDLHNGHVVRVVDGVTINLVLGVCHRCAVTP